MVVASIRKFSIDNRDEDGLRKGTTQDFGVQPKDSYLQFSKAPIMDNFGELPFGEIPEPLKHVRGFSKCFRSLTFQK